MDESEIRLLVIDDNVLVAQALSDLFGAFEGIHSVEPVHSGAEALAIVDDGGVDVVVMDMRMPGMDGIETTRALRSAHPDMTVIMHSAYSDPSIVQRAREAGVREYFVKGTPIADIVSVIRGDS